MYHLPSHIGRYEIKTLIGAGGMGSLYIARDTNPNTNRLVAVKLLNATLDSAELRERFSREARALAALSHPSIVDIYDSGEFQGSPFIVMEYVRGETLAEKIKRKAPLSLGQKLRLMIELCSGLAHAHEAGIIHRDIKPANLMVDRFGKVKILDFGIARMTERSLTRMATQMTQINVRIGTPGYMSPEQIEGGDIDRRSDIFAVGAVCYELLAYREAFTGANTRQVENNVLEGRRARLSSHVPDLDPAIEAIVDKALAKDPNDRYQDAAAFEEALERHRWKLGPEHAPPPPPKPTPTPGRKSDARAQDSRAEAAFRRSLAVYEEGAVEAARRFAIEALAEDPDYEDARAFIDRLGGNLFPPPPPRSVVGTSAAPTMLATGSHTTGAEGAAPTVLSSETVARGSRSSGGPLGVVSRHGKALHIAGIIAGVVLLVAAAVASVIYFWPRGPLLTVTRPKGGLVWASGISCGTDVSDCTAHIPEGETVVLSQQPDEGYVFTGFSGDCTKNGRVHMIAARTCSATFTPLPKEAAKVRWSLTITKPENGTLVGPAGISCGSYGASCTAEFADGHELMLRPVADANFEFRGFTGNCGPKGELVMKGARTCGATFVAQQKAAKPPPPPVPLPGQTRQPRSSPRERAESPGSSAGLPTGFPGSSSTVDVPRIDTPSGGDPGDPPARPPLAPPLSAEALAKKDILKVLHEYRDAYEALDFNALKRVYPSAPVSLKRNVFDDSKAMGFAFQGDPQIDADPASGTAKAKAKVLVSPKPKVGSQAPYEIQQAFQLVLRQNIWVIEKVDTPKK